MAPPPPVARSLGRSRPARGGSLFATREHRAAEASGALPVERIGAAVGLRLPGASRAAPEWHANFPPGFPAGPGGPRRGDGAGRLGSTTLLPSVPGSGWAGDPLPAPHS